MPPQVPPRPIGPRRAPRSMQDMTSFQNSQVFDHGSGENLRPIGEFPSMEAASITPIANHITTPKIKQSHTAKRVAPTTSSNNPQASPDRNELTVAAMNFVTNAGSERFRTAQGIPSMARERKISGESTKSLTTLPSIIPGPLASIPNSNTAPDVRSQADSGFAEDARQQQAQNGTNGTNPPVVDIHIDDENISTVYTNTNTHTHSDAGTVMDGGPVAQGRTPKCLRKVKAKIEPIRRFFKGKPLQRLCHNIEIWKWEHQQKKSEDYQEKKTKKEMKREQAVHVNFERDQARRAKEYVKAMKEREREGRVRNRGSRSKREYASDWVWYFQHWGRRVRECRAEREERVRKSGEIERDRIFREGDGTMTTWVRTSKEVEREERMLNNGVDWNLEESMYR